MYVCVFNTHTYISNKQIKKQMTPHTPTPQPHIHPTHPTPHSWGQGEKPSGGAHESDGPIISQSHSQSQSQSSSNPPPSPHAYAYAFASHSNAAAAVAAMGNNGESFVPSSYEALLPSLGRRQQLCVWEGEASGWCWWWFCCVWGG